MGHTGIKARSTQIMKVNICFYKENLEKGNSKAKINKNNIISKYILPNKLYCRCNLTITLNITARKYIFSLI